MSSVGVHLHLWTAAVRGLQPEGGAKGGVAQRRLLIGRLAAEGALGGGEVLAHLLPLRLLDVVPGGVLQVSLNLRGGAGERRGGAVPSHSCIVGNDTAKSGKLFSIDLIVVFFWILLHPRRTLSTSTGT